MPSFVLHSFIKLIFFQACKTCKMYYITKTGPEEWSFDQKSESPTYDHVATSWLSTSAAGFVVSSLFNSTRSTQRMETAGQEKILCNGPIKLLAYCQCNLKPRLECPFWVDCIFYYILTGLQKIHFHTLGSSLYAAPRFGPEPFSSTLLFFSSWLCASSSFQEQRLLGLGKEGNRMTCLMAGSICAYRAP